MSDLPQNVRIERDEVDGGFVVQSLDMPGAISQGETLREALENLNDAIECMIGPQEGGPR